MWCFHMCAVDTYVCNDMISMCCAHISKMHSNLFNGHVCLPWVAMNAMLKMASDDEMVGMLSSQAKEAGLESLLGQVENVAV